MARCMRPEIDNEQEEVMQYLCYCDDVIDIVSIMDNILLFVLHLITSLQYLSDEDDYLNDVFERHAN